ncbi:ubiquinone/menaquinone biosynthesis methyltransferase [bacterium]|nr:ubiquinone/menaquinone biosynthesis methyltransferase [bacterium]
MRLSIQKLFSEIPEQYELTNRFMTLGLDRFWRRKAARRACQAGGTRWLDMCAGTGDMTRLLADCAPAGVVVHAVDFSLPMLTRLIIDRETPVVRCLANAKVLPYPDASFDLITISFATRNLNITPDNLAATFREFYRVLKPGGIYVNIETSQPGNPFIGWFFHLYVRLTVRPLGWLIAGSTSAYRYLSDSIQDFYPADELARIMGQAGFDPVEYSTLLFGGVAIHTASKTL